MINLDTSLNRIDIYTSLIGINNKIPLRIEQPVLILDDPLPQIDLLVNTKKIVGPFYLTINAGDEIVGHFTESVKTSIQDFYVQFGALKCDNTVLYSTPIHIYCAGNKKTTLLEKLSLEKMVVNFNEL